VKYAPAVLAGSDWVGDNGPATQALLFQAEGVASDLSGNIYVADAQGHRVRQVSRAGVIRTIAGTGQPGFSGDGGPASAAQLNSPYGLAFDKRGNQYIADRGNGRVRRVIRMESFRLLRQRR
jgi:DNA-binding beta-propeller fold protein YncE